MDIRSRTPVYCAAGHALSVLERFRVGGVLLLALSSMVLLSTTGAAAGASSSDQTPVTKQELRQMENSTAAKVTDLESRIQGIASRTQELTTNQVTLDAVAAKLNQRIEDAGASAFDLNYKFQGNILTALGIVVTLILFFVTALYLGNRAWLRTEHEKFEQRAADMGKELKAQAISISGKIERDSNIAAEGFLSQRKKSEQDFHEKAKEVAKEVSKGVVDIAKLRVNAGVYLRVAHAFWDQFVETSRQEEKLLAEDVTINPLILKILNGERQRNLETAIRMTEVALEDAKDLHRLTPDFDDLLAMAKNNVAYYITSRQANKPDDKRRAALLAREAYESALKFKEREQTGQIPRGEVHWYFWWETYSWVLFNNANSVDKEVAKELMREVCDHPTPPEEWKAKKRALYGL